MKRTLYDLAKVIRSKNSGPFQVTLDVLFDKAELYYKIKESNIINEQNIARLYNLAPEAIDAIVFYDPALGFKITMERKFSSGSSFDTDVYGAQQHMPLGSLMIDLGEAYGK
jgi:hypothetical protein